MSDHRANLPREGFHADVLAALARKTLLNPLLVLPTLALATWPQRVRGLEAQYPKYFSRFKPSVVLAYLERANVYPHLRLLAVLAVLRVLNKWIGRRTLNNAVSDKYDWEKEIVLVTGGSDGIGKQIVLMLAQKNIKVIVLDKQTLTYDAPPSVSFGMCNIASTSEITTTASHIRQDIGEPTILINAQSDGVARGKTLIECSDDDIKTTFDVNTISHYKLAREFLPSMIKNNHGMIVTIPSTAAFVTAPRMTEYCASNAAALAFHEGLTAELVAVHHAPKVRCIVVNQGYTKNSVYEGFGAKTSFFAPALHIETVAAAVVDKVLSGSSGQLILPEFRRVFDASLRSRADWIQHVVRRSLTFMLKPEGEEEVVQPEHK